MQRGILKAIGRLCVIILIVLSGSAGDALAKEPIKIGYIGALSTPYGASSKAALEISIDELNKAGGILGRPVELITEDWKREVPMAVAAYKKLVMKDKCLLVFTEGTEGSMACAQVGARLYSSYPHLLFANWISGESFSDLVASEYSKYKFIFRLYTMASLFYNPNQKFMEFFKKTIGTKKVALLIEEAAWTETYRKGSANYPTQQEDFERNGIKVVYYSATDIKEKMFLPFFEQVAVSGADTIYWIAAYTDAVSLVKQWAQSPARNMDLFLQSSAGSYVSFWKMTGGRALGVSEAAPEIGIPYTKLSKPFLEKLKAKGAGYCGAVPTAYDGPWILKEAIEKAGSADNVEKLIKIVEDNQFQHGFFVWAFDKRHDPKLGYPYVSLTIGQFQEDGRYVLVHPKELVEITNPKDKYVRVKDLRKRAGLE